MNNEIIVFTHNDLDAISCMSNVDFALPQDRKVYFHTNYMNIVQRSDEVVRYQQQNRNTRIFVLDISFSGNKRELIDIINTGAEILFIDHHLYPEGYFEELEQYPNFKYIHKIGYSAGLLTYAHFKNPGKNNNLDYFTKLVDKYDIWRKDDPEFQESQLLNEYFYRNVETMSIENLMKKFVSNDYGLPRDYADTINIIKKEIVETKESMEKRKLIHRTPDITIIFTDKYFNFVISDEFKAGRQCCIIANDWGIIRIRISENSTLTEEQKAFLRLELTGQEDIGHENAFTYRVKNVSFDVIIEEIKRCAEIIQKELKKSEKLS